MIVNFETAKLAKEKGYNSPTESRYDSDGGICIATTGESYAAPTIFELQVWLFEEHAIWVEVTSDPLIKVYNVLIEKDFIYRYEDDEEYTNPFQALKEELINALNLIE